MKDRYSGGCLLYTDHQKAVFKLTAGSCYYGRRQCAHFLDVHTAHLKHQRRAFLFRLSGCDNSSGEGIEGKEEERLPAWSKDNPYQFSPFWSWQGYVDVRQSPASCGHRQYRSHDDYRRWMTLSVQQTITYACSVHRLGHKYW